MPPGCQSPLRDPVAAPELQRLLGNIGDPVPIDSLVSAYTRFRFTPRGEGKLLVLHYALPVAIAEGGRR